MPLNSVYVPCEISRGAFSSELIFEFSLQNGKKYKSVADKHYCLDSNKKQVTKDILANDQSITGYIKAYQVPSNDTAGVAYISIPDGEVVSVKSDDIESQMVPA